jgi:hypothetical protein
MPLPVPSLDDRRFDDLVAEARQRLAAHLPELTQVAPGDPMHALVDLFAWLTETILYRANLIPERQRRVLLNLLQVPLRAARPARALVCIDSSPRSVNLPQVLRDGSQVSGGGLTFTTTGEVQPTPLLLLPMIKQTVDDATLAQLGFTDEDLITQHGLGADDQVEAFQPRTFEPGREVLTLADSRDHVYYLALAAPRPLAARVDELRAAIAGRTLSLALAPADVQDGDQADEEALRDRTLVWELIHEDPDDGGLHFLPLENLADSSGGGRRPGVARLRLPANVALMQSLAVPDPLFAGVGERPPEPPRPVQQEQVALWLRLRCPEDPDLPLGYLGVNGVEAVGQAIRRDRMIGIGNGRPNQALDLPDRDIDPDSIRLEVEDTTGWQPWQRVEVLFGRRADETIYRLDAQAGQVHFGDGQHGRRPPEGRRIRIARYLHGGGSAGNLAAGTLKAVAGAGSLVVRQELPASGGREAETLAEAERRIPEFLTHRNRAVTRGDFQALALGNPVSPVARAEVIEGLLPGTALSTVRRDVPGVVSLFVVPPGLPELGRTPKPTQGLLKDVFSHLIARVLVGTELYVLSPDYVPLAAGMRVQVRDPSTEQQTLQAVRQALVEYLWVLSPGGSEGTGWPLGGMVRGKELETRVARVDGVREVGALVLFRRLDGVWQALGEDAQVSLDDYQLPDLLGVSVVTAGDPPLPAGLAPSGTPSGADGGDGSTSGGRVVPAPVIPELC